MHSSHPERPLRAREHRLARALCFARPLALGAALLFGFAASATPPAAKAKPRAKPIPTGSAFIESARARGLTKPTWALEHFAARDAARMNVRWVFLERSTPPGAKPWLAHTAFGAQGSRWCALEALAPRELLPLFFIKGGMYDGFGFHRALRHIADHELAHCALFHDAARFGQLQRFAQESGLPARRAFEAFADLYALSRVSEERDPEQRAGRESFLSGLRRLNSADPHRNPGLITRALATPAFAMAQRSSGPLALSLILLSMRESLSPLKEGEMRASEDH